MTYDDANGATRSEKRISRALAVGIHAGFVILLVFGISWQKRHFEPAAVVELWDSLPPPASEKAAPPPLPKPEPKPEPRPAPKPEVKPQVKPDIALKEKLEKERKAKEQQELEKKKKEEEAKRLKAAAEAKKKDDEKRKLEQERVAQETEAKRLAQEKIDLAKRLAAEKASAQAKLLKEYQDRMSARVRQFVVEPPGLKGKPKVEFDVVLIPGGEVLTVKLRRSSGVPAYDAAAERAILRASPLPLPPDPTLFPHFRELHLTVEPN